jgi:hypothetical protein
MGAHGATHPCGGRTARGRHFHFGFVAFISPLGIPLFHFIPSGTTFPSREGRGGASGDAVPRYGSGVKARKTSFQSFSSSGGSTLGKVTPRVLSARGPAPLGGRGATSRQHSWDNLFSIVENGRGRAPPGRGDATPVRSLPMRSIIPLLLGLTLFVITGTPARAETPEEWVTLGTRVHGGFGTFIPVGIRIGEDALRRLGTDRRGVTVIYSSGPDAPCPCIADGIAIATGASVGQGTLQVTPDKSPAGTLGVAVIRDKKTSKGLRYTVPASLLPGLMQWNKTLDALGRFRAVMDAPEQFEVVEVSGN